MFKRLFKTPTEKLKQTRVVLNHNQRQRINEAIKLEKVRKAFLKRGYKLPTNEK